MRKILNLFYTVYFNLRYLPLHQAIYLPIYVTTNLRDVKLRRGQIIIDAPMSYKLILVGGGKSPGMQCFNSGLHIAKGGSITFKGKAIISQGTVLRCDKNSTIEFGHDFYCNCNCYMRSSCKISFGDECALGWGITFNTSDGHHVWHNGEKQKIEAPIIIGNNVWITPNCSFSKGAIVPNGCIVAQKAVVTKPFSECNCVIGGVPAKVISYNISWKP